jgi:hypothetical protein
MNSFAECKGYDRIITTYHDGGIHACNYRGIPKTLNLVMCANQERKTILHVASILQ